ncbi:MAG: hypothetical protein KH026_08195 [Clostridium sp.]|nr:hypothetical protein [Clostridium sp.]
MRRKITYPAIVFLLLFSLMTDTASASTKKNRSRKKEAQSPYTLNMTTSDLLLGDSFILTVNGTTEESVTFKSSSSDVVSVEPEEDSISCQCTGETVGNATITVKIKEKGFLFFNSTATTLTCKVTVSPKASSIQFNRRQFRMAPNTKRKVRVTLRPSITTEVPVFSSSAPKIARVNAAQKIVAKAPGIAVITATIQNGNTATCRVIVSDRSKISD